MGFAMRLMCADALFVSPVPVNSPAIQFPPTIDYLIMNHASVHLSRAELGDDEQIRVECLSMSNDGEVLIGVSGRLVCLHNRGPVPLSQPAQHSQQSIRFHRRAHHALTCFDVFDCAQTAVNCVINGERVNVKSFFWPPKLQSFIKIFEL